MPGGADLPASRRFLLLYALGSILAGGGLDISGQVRAGVGTITTLTIPLKCFAAAGGDLAHVGTALRLAAPRGFAITVRNARLGQLIPMPTCPPTAH